MNNEARNLTRDEVEKVLNALENMIAWTARYSRMEGCHPDFRYVRDKAIKVYDKSVAIFDGPSNS